MTGTRVIIYSGKGGTGKTTVSAATAVTLAAAGKRVLVISSDPAHSLGDVFQMSLSRTAPTPIAENLFGLEIDTLYEAKRNMGNFEKFVSESYEKRGIRSSVASELSTQPGLDEIFSLVRLHREALSGQWDVVILDTSPTGNTLRLLAYPELIVGGSAGKKLFRLYQGMSSMMKPFGSSNGPDPEFFNEVNQLLDSMNQVSAFLAEENVTLRLVLNPEKLSILESKRAYTFTHIYGLTIDAVVVNKIYPVGEALRGAELGSYFDYWSRLHGRYLDEIESSFAPLPIFKLFLEPCEPLGVDALRQVGVKAFGETDVGRVLYSKKNMWVEERQAADPPDVRRFVVRIPFLAESEHVEVQRVGMDLYMCIGRVARSVSLPRILSNAEMAGYAAEGELLTVTFRERAREPEPPRLTRLRRSPAGA
ncbi:MAG: arsenic-transporting ATPase [Chloracidobacterium sp. CP2_5A]|nr:MAG: arsenic-transporting ATPase [Chloracidobacterium sp. CP2_5A]